MAWLAHTSRLGRLAAVLVALGLSGLPRVAAMAAPEEAHRCTCRAHDGDHDCTCAKCHAMAEKARQAAQPPCHAALARAAPERKAPTEPCLTGNCGAPEEPHPAVNGLDLFTLHDEAPRTAPPPTRAAAVPLPGPQHLPQPPETPPPRAELARARAALGAGAQAI